MSKFIVENGAIINQYTGEEYTIQDLCMELNDLEREARITKHDLITCIELKAVNRMLRMENRFLTIKLQQLAWRGMINPNDIEKEVMELCLNPKEASEYIHKFEKENFELKQQLKRCGEYNGDLL